KFKKIFSQWKNFPGQDAKNEPNLRKQALMLIQLHSHKALRAADLFAKTGVGGVTGARYVATLKKFGLINYTGARKKGQYVMTQKGIDFLEKASHELPQLQKDLEDPDSFTMKQLNYPVIEQQGIPVRKEVLPVLISSLRQYES